jgi:thiol-disulfide isomerase/thioredoxin
MINATKTTDTVSSRSKPSTPMLQKSILALTISLAFAIDKLTAKKLIFTSLSKIDTLNTTTDHLDDDKNTVLDFSLNTSTITGDEIEESLNQKQHVINVLSQELPTVAENEENEITIDVLADEVIETSNSSEQANIDTADINTETASISTSETAIGTASSISTTTIIASLAGVCGLIIGVAGGSDGGGGGGGGSENKQEATPNYHNHDTQENTDDTEDCSEDAAIGCSEPENNTHNNSITTGCGEGIIYSGSKQVSDFTLTDIQGIEHTLSELLIENKILVNFFSSGCSHCLEGVDISESIKSITSALDNTIILHIEMDKKTPQEQISAGIDNFNYNTLHNGENQLVFNLSDIEIENLSSYTAIAELETCGWPALYSINSEFDMIGIDRDKHTVEQIDSIIDSHIDPSTVLIEPNNYDIIFDSDSIVYNSMAQQIKYMDTTTNDGVANNWTLTDINGTKHTLNDYLDDGSTVILEYFALDDPRPHPHVEGNYLDNIKSDYTDVTVFRIEAMNSDEPKLFPDDASESDLVYVDLMDDKNNNFINNQIGDYILGNSSIGTYGLTEVPAIFFINSDNQFVKIASEELNNFTDYNHMYSELNDFNNHYDKLIESIDDNNYSIFTESISNHDLQDAPKWTLNNINGHEISLESILDSGKIVVMEHFATWCGACKNFEQSGLLSDLAERYSDEISVVMIEASNRSSTADLTEFMSTYHANGSDKIFIETETTAQDYGLEYYPTLHAINTEGEMIQWSPVRGSFSNAEELYEELLNFEALTTTI